ncbi:hypothetical protein NX059_011573 [Plenodomus lindquistii]|nr:hypothetical protein NX059_011573 [Plenodomus lindquistii]
MGARWTHTLDSPSRSEEPTPEEDAMKSSNLHSPFLHPTAKLSRHHTTLQDHTDDQQNGRTNGGEDDLTPRADSRRKGFMVHARPLLMDMRSNSRHPLPPEQSRSSSPPSLEEILRRRTIEDADDIQNFQLQHTKTDDPRMSPSPRSSTGDLERTDTRRSSIAVFAKGLVSRVPDLRMFTPEKPADESGLMHRRPSQEASRNRPDNRDRKLSFAPLPTTMAKQLYAPDLSLPAVRKEPPMSTTTSSKPHPEGAVGSGLRDRRKVKLDLPLPVGISNLPPRGRSPVITLSSLTPSRPRSPKTPWIRNEQLKWEPMPMAKSTPIIEENYAQSGIVGLLPGSDPIFSSSTPPIETPVSRLRDRSYVSRPRFPRARSGRSGRSGTSDSAFASTPDGSKSPEDLRTQWEKQTLTNPELEELGLAATSRRRRRWWKTSSDEGQQTPEPIVRRFSFNLFKRSNRKSDQSVDKDTQQAKESSTRKWHSKQALPFLNKPPGLASITIPPVFIPPGVDRVPTPPMFDADGEVKGKLADFFFDVQAGAPPRRKIKPTDLSGGYWDSDALLISLTSDINPADEEEDEGPAGPNDEGLRIPLDFDLNGTPGLASGGNSGEYLGFSTMNPGMYSPRFRKEALFPTAQDKLLEHRTIAALARQEEEDRRKFEWMVPEHYPTSWLCPLHEKYKGPWTGLCYWHGKRQSDRVILSGEYSSGRDKHGNLKPLGNTLKWNARNAAIVKKPAPPKKDSKGMQDIRPGEGKRRRLASLTI